MEKTDLELLKERYLELQEKHGLPGFQEMNEEFGIEKTDVEKFDLLIREIRRYVVDKVLNYMRFIEGILNPSNAPMFIFSVVKALEPGDKERLTEIYKRFSKIELDLIEIDLKFSEEKEVAFIKNTYSAWKESQKELLEILSKIKANWDKESEKSGKSFIR
jgi:hypothetical protein